MKKYIINIIFLIIAAATLGLQLYCCFMIMPGRIDAWKAAFWVAAATLVVSPAYISEYFLALQIKKLSRDMLRDEVIFRSVMILLNCAVLTAYSFAFVGFISGFAIFKVYTWGFLFFVATLGWWMSLLVLVENLISKRKRKYYK